MALEKDGERLFTRIYNHRTRTNGFKLRKGRFRLAISGGDKILEQLSREVVDEPSLEAFKVGLDRALI